MADLNARFIGKVLDKRYRINKIIGVGGMSIVFEALDGLTGKTVAVKVLKQDMAANPQAVERFVNESRAVSMLSHPNIVKIYDVSVKSSLKYIVMERIEGITLKSYIQRKGKLSVSEALSYTEQILSALSHAHAKGIVHRDIKPQNILLLKSGKVKVSDFGIATFSDSEPVEEKKAIGTVYYLSPEQAMGKVTDCRTDIYSTGVMLYEMVTGVLPFDAATPAQIARKHITEQPRRPHDIDPSIPLGVEQVILGAMEKSPDRRFSSAAEMGAFVGRLRTDPDYVFRPTSKKTGTVVPTGDNMAQKKKKNKTQSRSMFPLICGVTLAFIVVFSIAAFYLIDNIMKTESANSPETVDVPSAVGESYGDDIKKIFDPSIYKVIIETKYDSSYPENTIIKQDPVAGSKRKVLKYKQYCTVTLTVSKGSQTVSVPDLTVTEYRTAQIQAEKLGLKVEVHEVVSDSIEIGYVVSTDPVARTTVETGSTIVIYYSKGPSVVKYKMPSMTGLTPKAAYQKMDGNFKVGNVTYEYSDSVGQGKIISQSIPSGTQTIKGTAIDFVISLGKEPVVTEPVETQQEET